MLLVNNDNVTIPTSHWLILTILPVTEQPLRFSEPVAREQPLRFNEAVSRNQQQQPSSRFSEPQEPVRVSEPEPSQPILPARLTPIR